MTKTVDMVVNLKKSIQDNPEMYNAIKEISFQLYQKGIVKTADDINDAWTNALLAIIYNDNPQAKEIINQEVWEALQEMEN